MYQYKEISPVRAEKLYRHCLSAMGVYEAFEKMIDLRGLKHIFPGFEYVKRELEETLKEIEQERGGGDYGN